MTNSMPFSLDRCKECGEEVVNAEPGDEHFERQDGTPCGGEVIPLVDEPDINWSALQHC